MYTYFFGINKHGEIITRSKKKAAEKLCKKVYSCTADSIHEAERIARDTMQIINLY